MTESTVPSANTGMRRALTSGIDTVQHADGSVDLEVRKPDGKTNSTHYTGMKNVANGTTDFTREDGNVDSLGVLPNGRAIMTTYSPTGSEMFDVREIAYAQDAAATQTASHAAPAQAAPAGHSGFSIISPAEAAEMHPVASHPTQHPHSPTPQRVAPNTHSASTPHRVIHAGKPVQKEALSADDLMAAEQRVMHGETNPAKETTRELQADYAMRNALGLQDKTPHSHRLANMKTEHADMIANAGDPAKVTVAMVNDSTEAGSQTDVQAVMKQLKAEQKAGVKTRVDHPVVGGTTTKQAVREFPLPTLTPFKTL